MEPHLRSIRLIITFTLLTTCLSVTFANSDDTGLDEAVITKRISQMKSEVVPPKYDAAVRSYLRTYLVRNRSKAEEILGRSVLYFPLFEKYLKENNLPLDLKYLPVVESALNPKAISRASAVGLWQFMAGTAKIYGLNIDNNVDERCDPEKSTEAAMKHLESLYDQFDDWSLALAAYNSGSGRVSRAVKRARSKNFWTIRRYLPRETRNYVPAFIAATYLMHFYEDHDLTPEYPPLDVQITETIRVYDEFQLDELSQLTEVPMEIIDLLNPIYRKGFIPADESGNPLTLPKRVMADFKAYLEAQRPDAKYNIIASSPIYVTRAKEDQNYNKIIYTVQDGETLEKIAKSYNCSIYQLKAWNQLKTVKITSGQQLTIYTAKEFKQMRHKKLELPTMLPQMPIPALPPYKSSVTQMSAEDVFQLDQFVQYIVRRRERLRDIAEKLQGISIQDLEHLNHMPGKQMLKPGTIIRLKRMN